MGMIIENQAMVTQAVEAAVSRAEDPRLREILLALVRHLHGFVREVRLTEREFGDAVRLIAAMGQKTTAAHNEVMLMAGSLRNSGFLPVLLSGSWMTRRSQSSQAHWAVSTSLTRAPVSSSNWIAAARVPPVASIGSRT